MMDRVELAGVDWALVEANRLRIEIVRLREPNWSETLEETAVYLENLGKAPLDYVEGWLSFRPVIEGLRPRRTETVIESARGSSRGAPVPAPSRDAVGDFGGRWFVG